MRVLWLLPLAPALRNAGDLSCRGYRYNGIDWDHLRSTLEIYADKYWDRPQLLFDVLRLASQYGLEYHPENECVLGDLSLRFMLLLQVENTELRTAVASLRDQPPQSEVQALLQETFESFWDLKLPWSEVIKSGWSLFSVIATLARRLLDSAQDPCVSAERLQLYDESFDNAVYVPAEVDVATMLDAPHCPDAVASALLNLADNQRTTQPSEGNRYYRFTAASVASQPRENDSERLLLRAEHLLRKSRGWSLLTTQWPVWRLLDRLSAAEVVNVTSDGVWFWMYVFPHRVRSDGIISNRVRATREAYCLQLFQDEVKRLAAGSRRPLRLVEAGPHIGDCMLWASAVFGTGVRSLAVEPVPQVVSLFRRSIAANNFQIDLHHAWLGATSEPRSTGNSVPWTTLDELLDEDVDVLKIHTNGGERAILDGARKLFSSHEVRVVLVHSAEEDELWKAVAFLLERQYSVSAEGRPLTPRVKGWLREEVRSRGGLQIHALRR